MLLVLRFVLFVISAIVDINSPRDPSVNLLALAITCAALLTWGLNSGSMYKKWYNNILESSFILNLTILAVASYQVKVEGGNQAAVVYTSVSVAFVTFLGIMAYHVIEYITTLRAWRHSIAPLLQRFRETVVHFQRNTDSTEMILHAPAARTPQVTTTFVDLRESLLDSQC